MLLKLTVNLVAFLCSKVSDRALNKLKVSVDGLSTDLAKLSFLVNSVNALVCAKLKIDFI